MSALPGLWFVRFSLRYPRLGSLLCFPGHLWAEWRNRNNDCDDGHLYVSQTPDLIIEGCGAFHAEADDWGNYTIRLNGGRQEVVLRVRVLDAVVVDDRCPDLVLVEGGGR